MSAPFVAEIRIFAGNFAPTGWAQCSGQLMPISQNTALFSLLGTFYGGDGKSTFALPNFEGSAPMNWGQGAGLTPRDLGEMAGEDTVTLITTEIPAHNHNVKVLALPATKTTPDPAGGICLGRAPTNVYLNPPDNAGATMSPFITSISGGSLPHNNMQPYLVLMFIIALQGVFPARP
jgi:microcystin-dependent protein